jgi:hypothetical protein
MSEGAPAAGRPARGAPLIVTAEMPPDIFSWANSLRTQHFPPERNYLRAHVTLFHALPPSAEAEVRQLLSDLAKAPAPPARISGVMNLGSGTAFAIDSPAMADLHGEIQHRLHGLLTSQDAQPPRLHVTIQNKVKPAQARQLQEELCARFQPRDFRFRGFGLHAYEGGPWRSLRTFPFRGQR